MIRFLLNNKLIRTDKPPGMLLLDFVRYHEHLTGTKIGCREGDCGACTVLLGEWKGGKLSYRSVTSCLTALGNVQGKQVVTIEGLNMESLSPIQQAICEEGGTQCGFCTPGFIVSMAGFCLSDKTPTPRSAIAAVDGNICRCTGYKSIERALDRLVGLLQGGTLNGSGATANGMGRALNGKKEAVDLAVEKGLLPDYFTTVRARLQALAQEPDGIMKSNGTKRSDDVFREKKGARFLGGGTDLYVQQHDTLPGEDLNFLSAKEELRGVVQEGNRCQIGGAATVTDLMESPVIQHAFPSFDRYAHLISSTPIRNIATVAGNFVNASPIGDLSVLFLALDARLTLSNGLSTRELPLREFYRGYKLLNKNREEFIEKISFDLPGPDTFFHFEKVSKRTCLDIASVNTALRISMNGHRIVEAHLSAGGVGPIPAYLSKTATILRGKVLSEPLILEAVRAARAEIAPISDARGTADYKSLLLGQLIKAHFLTLFPNVLQAKKLLEIV